MKNTTELSASADGEISALRRKLVSARSAESETQRRSLPWALRLSLARSATDLCDLPLAAIDASQVIVGHEGLADHLSHDCLLVLLDGADGQIGAVSLDSSTVTALIQQQTMGKVFDPIETDRRFTNTDAAMIAPLIDRTLEQAAESSDQDHDRQAIEGYRFGARVGDERSLLLALACEDYRVITLSVDISLGLGQGRICFLLPDIRKPAAPAGPQTSACAPGPTLQDAAGVVRAELSAVVGRLTVTLADLSRLAQGDTLVLPKNDFNQSELVAIDGRLVALGQLGQASGARAIKISGVKTQSDLVEAASEVFSAETSPASQERSTATGETDATGPPDQAGAPGDPAPAKDPVLEWTSEAGHLSEDVSAPDTVAEDPADQPVPPDSGPAEAMNPGQTGAEWPEVCASPPRNLPVPRV